MPVQSPNNYNLYMNTGIVNSHSGLVYNYEPQETGTHQNQKNMIYTGGENLINNIPGQAHNAQLIKMQPCSHHERIEEVAVDQIVNTNNTQSSISETFTSINSEINNGNMDGTISMQCTETTKAAHSDIVSQDHTTKSRETDTVLSTITSLKTSSPQYETKNQIRNVSQLPRIPKLNSNSISPQKFPQGIHTKRTNITSDSEDDEPLSKKLSKIAKIKDDDEPLSIKLNKISKNKVKEEIISPSKSTSIPKVHHHHHDKDDLSHKKNVKSTNSSHDRNGLIKKESSNQSDKSKSRHNHDIKKENISPIQSQKSVTKIKSESRDSIPTKKKRTKGEPKDGEIKKEDDNVWKWWEEESREDGVKWNTLEHKGPIFAPDYQPLPGDIIFRYDGKVTKLSKPAEEVAGFYARMLEHDYVTKQQFNDNFLKDWRRVMNKEERITITDLAKCDFNEIAAYFKLKSEERKNMSKEEKLQNKKEQEEMQNKYGFCILDGRPQKIGNYKIEPPGLFRGRGDHPKMGRLKRRIEPEDVIINCGKHGVIPAPPPGHKWKEIRHDNTVTWLCSWTENIQQSIKYVMLNPSSKLKGEKDWMKYETARRLKTCVDKIRQKYREDWKSKVMLDRQRGVALYFIDKLALRAGNEKEEGETADTVGCCSLRVEHVKLHEKLGDEEYVIEFDFLGKDCIRYQNNVPVEKRVFKNIQLFMQNKKGGDDLFDRLTTMILNKHLNEQMEGLTAKVFRTFNASMTLQDQLNKLTTDDSSIHEKLLSYNRANRAVAILCNHQRSIPKTHGKQMENLQDKIKVKKEAIAEARHEAKVAKSDCKKENNQKNQLNYEKKKLKMKKLQEQLLKLDLQSTDKEENKNIALGTSKLNYLDPRITVAWCKKHDMNIAKLYNKTQREKFLWAIEMATPDFVF